MAVQPLVAQEPWALAGKEAQLNNDLYKLFYNNSLQQQTLRLQNELGMNANQQKQAWQSGENASTSMMAARAPRWLGSTYHMSCMARSRCV